MGWYVYFIAGVLLIIAVLIGRSRGGNSMRMRDNSGNVIVGDITGTVSQTSAPLPRAPEKSAPDRVAWGIAIAGVLVAVAQLAHDVLAAK